MENQQTNPLTKFFRQPSIYLKLPSGGQFYADNSLNQPAAEELPVYPLTAKDEITLRTPDALINGASVVAVFQSCIPAIVDAWAVPSIDVDAIFIAIRIASYGHKMGISVSCPACKAVNEYEIDLRNSLARITSPNFQNQYQIGPLKVKFKPQSYALINKINMLRYEDSRVIDQITKSELSNKEKLDYIKDQMQKISDLNLEGLVGATEYIQTPDNNIVTDPAFIMDFYKNVDAASISQLEKYYADIVKDGGAKPEDITCGDCKHEFKTTIEFDYANFFVKGS